MDPPRQSAGHLVGEDCCMFYALVSNLEVLFLGVLPLPHPHKKKNEK